MQPQFVSYPKSGRTWVRFALHQLGVADRICFHHDTFEFNAPDKPPPDLDFEQRLRRCRGWGPTVYLTREPRDILVSLYFQVTGRFEDFFHYRGTISELIRDDYFGARHLKAFRDQWEDLCRQGLATRISYEQCHQDLGAVLRRVLQHFQIDATDAAIEEAAKSARFENMKAIEEGGSFQYPWLRLRNGAPKVRHGVPGGYRGQLPVADLEYLEDIFGPPLESM
jgi:hypothetical protein